MTLCQPFYYTGCRSGVKKMIDNTNVKTLISAYRYIEKTCESIDNYIYRHAINFGPDPEICSTQKVINNILDLMERKNRLYKLKDIIDETVENLPLLEKQILILKMRYRANAKTLQQILKISSERTAFRKIDQAIEKFKILLNKSQFTDLIKRTLTSEAWIARIQNAISLDARM